MVVLRSLAWAATGVELSQPPGEICGVLLQLFQWILACVLHGCRVCWGIHLLPAIPQVFAAFLTSAARNAVARCPAPSYSSSLADILKSQCPNTRVPGRDAIL